MSPWDATSVQLTLQKKKKKAWTKTLKTWYSFSFCLLHVHCEKWTEKYGWQRIYCLHNTSQTQRNVKSVYSGWSRLYSLHPWQKSCLSHKTDWPRDEKPTAHAYNNNSLSADTRAAAVIFASPQWGNIDICKSTEGIRQGSLPPAVQGQWHAGSNQELCASPFRMERIWRGRRIIPIVDKQSHQRESRCGGGELWFWGP